MPFLVRLCEPVGKFLNIEYIVLIMIRTAKAATSGLSTNGIIVLDTSIS
jgi:hypothetical protein